MDDDTQVRRLVADIMNELDRARKKFPGANCNLAALTEEAGEMIEALIPYCLDLSVHHGRLARALLHHRPTDGGDGKWEDVRKECIQVCVMAMRVALEGDPTLGVVPMDTAPPPPGCSTIGREHVMWKDGAWDRCQVCGYVDTAPARHVVFLNSATDDDVVTQIPLAPLTDTGRQALHDILGSTAAVLDFLDRVQPYLRESGVNGRTLALQAGNHQRELEMHRLPIIQLRDAPFDETQDGGICTQGHDRRFVGDGTGAKRCERCGETTCPQDPAVQRYPQDGNTLSDPVPPFDNLTISNAPEPIDTGPVQVPSLPSGVAVISVAVEDRVWTGTKQPAGTHYRVERSDGNLVADWRLDEFLRAAGVLDPIAVVRITTPVGMCRIEQDSKGWTVEQWDGKHWEPLCGDVAESFARGVYNRRMKENFPDTKGVPAQLQSAFVAARKALLQVRNAADNGGMPWSQLHTLVVKALDQTHALIAVCDTGD